MKTFIIALLLGVIIGAGGLWSFSADQKSPALQRIEERAGTEAGKAVESAQAMSQQARQVLAAKLESLELRAEDVTRELAEKGRVVRRKARDMGEAAIDLAIDARTTATIKARYAADPELSVFTLSVATTGGRVTLSGTVSSPELIGKAMALALETDGVREVISTIEVS